MPTRLNLDPKWPFWVTTKFPPPDVQQDVTQPDQVPSIIARRRLVLPQVRRGRIQDTAWITTAAPPPETVWTPVNRSRLLRYASLRRPRRTDLPSPQQILQQPLPSFIVSRRHKPLQRRLRRTDLPLPQQFLPAFIVGRRHKPPLRRSRRADLPPSQQFLPTLIVGRRYKLPFSRRGRTTTPFWTQIVVQASTWIPNITSRRTRIDLQKRGRRTSLPLVGGPVAFAWLPKQLPRRLRTMSMFARRGRRRSDVVVSQAAAPTTVWTPQLTSRRARIIARARVARRMQVVPEQMIPVRMIARTQRRAVQIRRPLAQRVITIVSRVVPVQIVPRTRKRLLALRRGKRFDIVPAQIIQPSVWRPGIVRSRWAKGFHRRRQMFGTFVVHNASRIFPMVTTGETDRPEGGTTDRGQSGETESSSRGDVL